MKQTRTYTSQRDRFGRPCVGLDWLSRAGSCFPSGSRRCWVQAARRKYTCDRGSQTSQTSAHTDFKIKGGGRGTKVSDILDSQHTIPPWTGLKGRSWRITVRFVITHNLLSGSFSLIFSKTLISRRAASLYFSTFLMIFKATWVPPLPTI